MNIDDLPQIVDEFKTTETAHFTDEQEDLFNLLVEFLTKKNYEGVEITNKEALEAYQAAKQQVKYFEE